MDRFDSIYQHWKKSNQTGLAVLFEALPSNSNLTPAQIDFLMSHASDLSSYGNQDVMNHLAQYSKLTEEQFNRVLATNTTLDRLARNSHLTSEQIDRLDKIGGRADTIGGVKERLAEHSKLTKEQFTRFFQSREGRKALGKNRHLTTEQIDTLYKDEAVDKDFLAARSLLTQRQFNRFFNDPNFDQVYLTINSRLTTEQIDRIYQAEKGRGTEKYNLQHLASHSKLTEEQFTLFLKNDRVSQTALAKNPHLTPEQIDLLYGESDSQGRGFVDTYTVRQSLARKSHLTDDQWARFVNHPDFENHYLQKLARNPSINPDFRIGIINWMW